MNNKEKLEQLMEALVGDNAMQRYTHKEILEYVSDLKDIEQKSDKYTYIYGDECPDIWNSLGFTIHDNDDRIKLQFVKYEERGSYD
tara:strand:- start:81 stop:338 length:258 start_codon:yes stop_codon:yes gene_type:complete